eukprot:TRINITY_DN2515_c0_g2_i1.p2 TRINITY_DN2515_c0_g2~~TRINITY_DN2515_c0_g2_i1.p2  ORF type:complete len:108 (+),score=34.80 TRINITY_DN2515_c0_g2_i1:173-496(+)
MKLALKPGGIICSQAESMWLHRDIIKALVTMCRSPDVGFTHVQYAYISIPTYPSGTIGMLLCSTGNPCDKPVRQAPAEERATNFKYYNPELHSACFVLPTFMRAVLS